MKSKSDPPNNNSTEIDKILINFTNGEYNALFCGFKFNWFKSILCYKYRFVVVEKIIVLFSQDESSI